MQACTTTQGSRSVVFARIADVNGSGLVEIKPACVDNTRQAYTAVARDFSGNSNDMQHSHVLVPETQVKTSNCNIMLYTYIPLTIPGTMVGNGWGWLGPSQCCILAVLLIVVCHVCTQSGDLLSLNTFLSHGRTNLHSLTLT